MGYTGKGRGRWDEREDNDHLSVDRRVACASLSLPLSLSLSLFRRGARAWRKRSTDTTRVFEWARTVVWGYKTRPPVGRFVYMRLKVGAFAQFDLHYSAPYAAA